MSAEPQLAWDQAEVEDRRLRVPITGARPPGWDDAFERTAVLLGGREWEKVKLKKDSVRVSGLRPGSEERLHHFLESVVQQASADHPGDRSDNEQDDEDERSAAPHDTEDEEMTERFRGFARSRHAGT